MADREGKEAHVSIFDRYRRYVVSKPNVQSNPRPEVVLNPDGWGPTEIPSRRQELSPVGRHAHARLPAVQSAADAHVGTKERVRSTKDDVGCNRVNGQRTFRQRIIRASVPREFVVPTHHFNGTNPQFRPEISPQRYPRGGVVDLREISPGQAEVHAEDC